MKNYKLVSAFMFLFFATTLIAFSQSNYGLLNAKKASEIGAKSEDRVRLDHDKPLPYEYVDERDILWSKVVWESIDLYQKQNYRLYYPINEENVLANTKSLFSTLLDNIRNGKITEVYEDSQFINKLPVSEVEKKLVRIDTASYGYDMLNQGETNIDEYIDKNFIKAQDIQSYQIKGIWYFNKITGQMNYRLLAIAPMAPDVQTIGRDDIMDDAFYPLFWVFYPDARTVLHNSHPTKNGFAAHVESYDYILNTRAFSSVIIKEENMFGNRSINEYIRGNSLFQLREAEKIKDEIRNLESDMWTY
ncbi:type IX secretion system ring subunit PorN/GldN [Wenyingzhuangia aestuarii]|uniref:type IX secretion system ring protein PorN/GldN n=1 Tax=Wenyingzhuangia aestuarii TaxID=1647582 RepID=UPI001FD84947|nr:gliding motility protein GldN [Wenyingzhuangia aestuarii]NJB81987.1 gliding motility associated protein GldN [Wenyingzhuangia aestuarii]